MVVETHIRGIIALVLLAVSAVATLGPPLYPWETHPGEFVRVDLSWVTDPATLKDEDLESAAANLVSAALATSPNGKECFQRLLAYCAPHNVGKFEHIRIPDSVISRVEISALRWLLRSLPQQYLRHGMQILQSAYERNNISLIRLLSTFGVKCSLSAGDTYAYLVTMTAIDMLDLSAAAGLRPPSSDDDPLWHVELYQRSHDNGSVRKIDVSGLRNIGAWSTEVDFVAYGQILRLLIVLVEHGFQLVTRMTAYDQVIAEHPLEQDIAKAIDLDPAWQLKLLDLLACSGARMTNVLEELIMSRAGRIDSALNLMQTHHMRPSFDPTYIERLINMGGSDRIRRAKLVLRYGGYTATTLPNGMTPRQMAMKLGDVDLANVFDEYDEYAAFAAMYDTWIDYH
ncbi:Uncharacterized protein PBTT_03801 [Plasmodiophora brassicae]|uniref:Uncharacterized protein n=1 Tax=Plasmodiophora brassicae TaxID=37360 RepID=A0A0G4ISQ3_PLABS|nr:hypothetical protein PBRA_006278 [Plasmodiophora brassicae]SPQ96015.1 unnamed protein product [Plasmodiophora brassicae]